jgi:cytochrome b561
MTLHRYPMLAILLHWLIALLLIGSFTMGLRMVGMDFSPGKINTYAYHKWLGVTIFGLVVVRFFYRQFNPPPALPSGMPTWQKNASFLSHSLLYVLLFVVPVSGWIYSSAAGVPTVPFGQPALQLPDLFQKDPDLATALKQVHFVLTRLLLVLIFLHMAAALKHHWWDKDGVMHRMLPKVKFWS